MTGGDHRERQDHGRRQLACGCHVGTSSHSGYAPRVLMRRHVASLLAAGSLLLAVPTRANGRFPEANQIATTPANPDLLMVRVSFGLLISKDAGASFDWICEPAMGYGGIQDPGIAVMADGSLVVAAFEGLTKSTDGGCDWTFEETEGLAKEFVIDVAAERVDPKNAVVVTSTGKPDGTFNVRVFRTTDNAKTWLPTGPALDGDILSETVDVAPSDPTRLYVAGEVGQGKDRKGVIATSSDGGKTWTRADVDLKGDVQLFIAGVDPVDKDRLYLRTVGLLDRLLASKDGGKTFEEITKVTRPMSGFAVSEDGMTIALGGPDVGFAPGTKPDMTVERRPSLLTASKDSLSFTELSKKTSQCLAFGNGGFFACGEQNNDGYIVGRAPKPGDPFTPLMPKLANVRGPLACPTGTKVDTLCKPAWPALQQQLGGGQAGQGGATSGAGGGAAGPAAKATEDGCSCAQVSPRASLVGLGASVSLLAIFAKRRRKTRDNAGESGHRYGPPRP